MKNKFFTVSIFVITAVVVGLFPYFHKVANANVEFKFSNNPKIQIAILLDTSSSMNGLINQTRNQLWQIVNEFSKAEQNGVKPKIEVAVYEYGNSRLSASSGYIRQVSALTGELDQVSEALFSLTTNGGNEYCGFAITTAVSDLKWSKSGGDIKAIFIAGNEPFTQGPVSFRSAIYLAKEKGIIINTIHAGNMQLGANTGWKEGALLAGGEYMSIEQNHKVVHFDAPQDKALAKLNEKLNKTYIPYGKKGKEKFLRQKVQDDKNNEISSALLSKRIETKASSMYDNSNWDLLDAVTSGKIDLNKIDEKKLPKNIRKISKNKRKDFVQSKIKERLKLKKQILELSVRISNYVAKKRKELGAPSPATINEAVTSAIQKQGALKSYKFNK